jgi:hypothetical protein
MRETQFSRVEGMVNRASGKPIATCRNVHQAKHVRLHGLDPSVEKGIVRRLQGKIPLENVRLE